MGVKWWDLKVTKRGDELQTHYNPNLHFFQRERRTEESKNKDSDTSIQKRVKIRPGLSSFFLSRPSLQFLDAVVMFGCLEEHI